MDIDDFILRCSLESRLIRDNLVIPRFSTEISCRAHTDSVAGALCWDRDDDEFQQYLVFNGFQSEKPWQIRAHQSAKMLVSRLVRRLGGILGALARELKMSDVSKDDGYKLIFIFRSQGVQNRCSGPEVACSLSVRIRVAQSWTHVA